MRQAPILRSRTDPLALRYLITVSTLSALKRQVCVGTGLIPASSVTGLGSFLRYLHWFWAYPFRICTGTGTGLTRALGLSLPLRHMRRGLARPCHT